MDWCLSLGSHKKADPKMKSWVEEIYLRGDSRKYSWVKWGEWARQGEKQDKSELVSGLLL